MSSKIVSPSEPEVVTKIKAILETELPMKAEKLIIIVGDSKHIHNAVIYSHQTGLTETLGMLEEAKYEILTSYGSEDAPKPPPGKQYG